MKKKLALTIAVVFLFSGCPSMGVLPPPPPSDTDVPKSPRAEKRKGPADSLGGDVHFEPYAEEPSEAVP